MENVEMVNGGKNGDDTVPGNLSHSSLCGGPGNDGGTGCCDWTTNSRDKI